MRIRNMYTLTVKKRFFVCVFLFIFLISQFLHTNAHEIFNPSSVSYLKIKSLQGYNYTHFPNQVSELASSEKENPVIIPVINQSSPYERSTISAQISLINHGPIFIDGDTSFNNTASSEGWSGNGTSLNPYIIEGLNITGGVNLITIQNTNVFFEIRDCILQDGSGIGIRFYSARNGIVSNVSILNCGTGIYMEISGSIRVENSLISHINSAGISLSENGGLIFVNNTIVTVSVGMFLHFMAMSMTITDNTINDTDIGIKLIDNSQNNVIANNSISSSTDFGIFLGSLSSNNIIKHNNFIANNDSGFSQAYDDGSGNTFSFNYWDDWTVPDSNNDGIVDIGYSITGSASNNDNSPLIARTEFILGRQVHFPLIIDGNSDFSAQASLEGFLGSGTQSFPYLMADLFIQNFSAVLIKISNTDVHFTINNCFLNGINHSTSGIELSNVTNGIVNLTRIQNCNNGLRIVSSSSHNTFSNNTVVSNSEDGFVVFTSNENTFSYNLIQQNSWYGMRFYTSDLNNISGNLIQENSWSGLTFYNSSLNNVSKNRFVSNAQRGLHIQTTSLNNCIVSNDIYQNTLNGIYIEFDSDFTQIHNNSITSNGNHGLRIHSSCNNRIISNTFADNYWSGIDLQSNCNYTFIHNNTIVRNNIGIYVQSNSNNNSINENFLSDNTYDGVRFYSASNNSLTNNTISDSSWNGLSIKSSSQYNSIQGNNFTSNNFAGVEIDSVSVNNTVIRNLFFRNNIFASSQGFDDGINNIFVFNHWDNWVLPDTNADDIVDISYSVEGSSNNSDAYPLVHPIIDPFHLLVSPNIVYPSGGIILSGNITINWIESIDTLAHKVTSSVSYSSDGGSSWIPLALYLNTSTYEWNTATVSDGINYNIKIEVNCSKGLIRENTMNFSFIIDNNAPIIFIDGIINDTLIRKSDYPHLDTNITDITLDIVRFNWDNSLNQTISSPYDIFLPAEEGYHWLFLYANDSVGHTTIQRYRWWIDPVPIINLVSPENNSILLYGSNIHLNITDNSLDRAWYIWDSNGENQSFGQPWIVAFNLSDDWHRLEVFGIDVLGQMVISHYLFYCDSQAPEIILIGPENDTEIIKSTIINLDIIELFLNNCWFNVFPLGTGNNTLTSPWDISLNSNPFEDGYYWVYVYAQDSVGHVIMKKFRWFVFSDNSSVIVSSYHSSTTIQITPGFTLFFIIGTLLLNFLYRRKIKNY